MSIAAQQFTAALAKVRSRVVLPVPFDADAVWGKKQRHHLTGSINSCPFRGELEYEDGRPFLALGPAWRRSLGLEAGDTVVAVLRPEPPQLDEMPDDMVAAIVAAPGAQAFFESLPSFYRKNYVRWIEDAKKPETREARITETVRLLAAGERER